MTSGVCEKNSSFKQYTKNADERGEKHSEPYNLRQRRLKQCYEEIGHLELPDHTEKHSKSLATRIKNSRNDDYQVFYRGECWPLLDRILNPQDLYNIDTSSLEEIKRMTDQRLDIFQNLQRELGNSITYADSNRKVCEQEISRR